MNTLVVESNMVACFALDRLRAHTIPHRFRAVLCEKRVAEVHPTNIIMFGFCLHRLGRKCAYQWYNVRICFGLVYIQVWCLTSSTLDSLNIFEVEVQLSMWGATNLIILPLRSKFANPSFEKEVGQLWHCTIGQTRSARSAREVPAKVQLGKGLDWL